MLNKHKKYNYVCLNCGLKFDQPTSDSAFDGEGEMVWMMCPSCESTKYIETKHCKKETPNEN